MSYPSSKTSNSTYSLNFSNGMVVFFGFPTEKKMDQFVALCDEMGVYYQELAYPRSKYWHYEKCFEISVSSEDDLNAIQPIINRFGELNALADSHETVIVLRTLDEIQRLYLMINELSELL